MGENWPIKHFNVHPPHYHYPLFPTKENRMPIVRRLLSSPWVRKASDLGGDEGSSRDYRVGKRCRERVQVHSRPSSEHEGTPAAAAHPEPVFPARPEPIFLLWRNRRYRIERVIDSWCLTEDWWESPSAASRVYFRVLTRRSPRGAGAVSPSVFDLSYEYETGEWWMEGWWD